MKIYKHAADWKSEASLLKNQNQNQVIGFVPTMGALHKGHGALILEALKQCDHVVVSIYVNPTQFNDPKDFEKYPQTWQQDCEYLESLGVHSIFHPSYGELYPDGYVFKVNESKDSEGLCGASRPGHFDGVLTVVMKLLNIIKADKAFFGEKDYQQYRLISEMAKAFFLDCAIVACPTIREDSGLALSSRNTRLSLDRQNYAAQFFSQILAQKNMTLDERKNLMIQAGLKVDYLEERWGRRLGAVWIDDVRLIDNVKI